jgi:hypothetical protein
MTGVELPAIFDNMKTFVGALLLLICTEAAAQVTEIPLQYQPLLAAYGFTSPVVEVSVNGEIGLFLIDSGASIHVVSEWFSQKAKLQTGKSGSVGGSSGGHARSTISKIDLKLSDRLGHPWVVSNQLAAIVPLDDGFKKNGLAGILSPQELAREDELCTVDLWSFG